VAKVGGMAGTMIARTASGSPQRTQLPSQELLDDLCSRFVLNVPEEELQAFERILFSVEQAHWFYEDNAMEQNMALKSLSLREFTSLMFQSCAALRPYITHIDDIYKDFTTYKTRVPVMGAIILDETLERCLLVKGWKAGASWSFPRGKKNKGEEDHCCASREVQEETGYDIHPKLKLEDHLEVVMGQQRMRLYIIPGVKDDTMFAPQTKKEVSEIAWHRVDELPVASTDSVVHHRGPTGLKYFMVFPFVTPLKSWIAKKRPQYAKRWIPLPGVTIWKVKSNLRSSGGLGPLSQNYVNAVMPAVPAAVAAPVPSSEKIRSSPRGSPKQSPKVSPKQSPRKSPRVTSRAVSKTPPPQMPPRPVPKGPPGNAFRNFRFDFARILQQLDG
jgi:mRNA-decapping enzyme subunit 2